MASVPTSNRILFFHRYGFTNNQQYMVNNAFLKAGINYNYIFYTSIAKNIPGAWIRKNQRVWETPRDKQTRVKEFINDSIRNLQPKIIVVADECALWHFAEQRSLDTCRGSVYFYNGIPVIVLDDILKCKSVKYMPWLYGIDIRKVKRWYDGQPRTEPAFDYTLCTNRTDLARAASCGAISLYTSIDIETAAAFITSIGYTFLLPDGRVRTFTIPFVDPNNETGAYWLTDEEEVDAWTVCEYINDSEAPKVFQNGMYDSAWLLRFRRPPNNYFGDTMHIWHCIWPEAPKSLDFIASVCCDNVRYWKHEIKGELDAKQASRLPPTRKGMEMYWRYNGLDTYWTLLSFLYLVRLITTSGMEWALVNYDTEFRLQVGPCFAMSMRGFKVDKPRQSALWMKWMREHEQALAKLRTMVADKTFNPSSPHQVASLIYDVLGAKPIKMRGAKTQGKDTARSVDEKILKIIKHQHPLFGHYIQAIWDSKKPLNNASKYGKLWLLNNRLMYQISMLTETGRAISKQHMYWYGTNAQNIPGDARSMLVADDGYMLFDADYSQSDAFFVAFYSGDERFINTMLDDKDSHCVHASFFFNEPYEKIYDSYKRKDPWAVHPTKGVRQNTKRIVHGSNYRMAGGTLYIVMGHDAVVATAHALGHKDAHTWTMRQLGNFCQSLIDAYMTKMYPGLPRWFKESVDEAIRNGNKVTVYGGRTRLFFGDLATDEGVQRELSAYYGQGGTAGNINRTLLETYYNSELESPRGGQLQLLLQTHDSITGQVPLGRFDLIDEFLTLMHGTITIKDRTFKVPVECEVGLSWKDGMIPYVKGTTSVGDIFKAEAKLVGKYERIRAGVNVS